MVGPLTIWCNASLGAEALAHLRSGAEPHRLLLPSTTTGNLSSGGPSPDLASADLAFGQPDPDQSSGLQRLMWIHLTSAGYTRYDTDSFRHALASRKACLTNSSSVYNEPCAQHLLAFMLASARKLHDSFAQQRERVWAFDRLRSSVNVLSGDTVLIVGFGAIGRRLADLLRPFNLRLIGLRRSPTGTESIPTYGIESLDRFLGEADHVVNVLPANDSTKALFGSRQFDAMKTTCKFYNVGRGTTVDQAALLEALEKGRLAAAYLDVTDPEPLPPDSPLWTVPNCVVTPHVAGGFAQEDVHLVRHFLSNLRKYELGEPLTDRVI